MAGNPRLSSAFIITFSAVIVGADPGFAPPAISAEDLILRIVDDVPESSHKDRLVLTQGAELADLPRAEYPRDPHGVRVGECQPDRRTSIMAASPPRLTLDGGLLPGTDH